MDFKCHIYFVTEQALSRGRATIDIVKQAIAGGVDAIQLREKHMEAREVLELGYSLKEILRRHQIPLIVNDRIDIAMALDADGVHLGQTDLPIEVARKLLGPDKIVGISVSRVEEALEAVEKGADYLGVGPIFPTGSKEDAKKPIGLEGLQRIREKVNLHLTAIGGVNRDNAAEVIKAGADSIAVISALSAAENVEEAARELRSVIDKASKKEGSS
jgi:thiamine-phosphate pyrophosphorylase